ncbi:NaeI family type II restriction endonuclease [Salinibacterium sp. TMP30]|uniref:NaeI family type II restriction endonuclease n=1 Tax=Salinibacterium sp. TMP30 TaxID=3138237 RepID=UPI003138D2E4
MNDRPVNAEISFDPYLDADDQALVEVAEELIGLDPTGERWAAVLRHTYDMIYNGQETGRYKWEDLMKTEKTHFGTLFEINAQREFGFDGGDRTDFTVAGHEVDAKWSQSDGGWMLPPEVFDELALVATASDAKGQWSLGLVRVELANRREKSNRDKKTQLNKAGREAIRWLWRDAPLPPNVLLLLDPNEVAKIFEHRSGTQRTHRLFRAAEGMVVHRSTVATVSMQMDPQKRVRYNGGSRDALRSEGIVILSGKYHSETAQDLGVPIPGPLEYISVRVVQSTNDEGAVMDGVRWRRANPSDPIVEAPLIPERGARNKWA